jgi:hypothetical protein
MDNQQESAAASPEQAAAATPDDNDVIPTDERTGTLIFAAVLTLFGIFWVWASSDLPDRQQTAYLSQGFLPITAGVLLAGLSALLFVSTWLTKAVPPAQLGREPLFGWDAELRAVGIFVALAVYIFLLPHLHYLINTFILMLVGLAIAREPLRPRLFILAAFMSVLFYGIFVWGIKLPLPGSGME